MIHRAATTLVVLVVMACARAAHAQEDYLEVAKGIGDYLVEVGRQEGKGIRWAQYEGPGPDAHEEERYYPVSLYTGVTGTGLFLLNLWHATKEDKYLQAAKGAGRYLIATAKPLDGGGVCWEATAERRGHAIGEGNGLGLYVGNAGIGLFLAYLHEATGEKTFADGAKGAFARILREAAEDEQGIHWGHGGLDIIAGEAGIGLALLEMYRLTEERPYRAAALKVASWLLAQAEEEDDRVRWKRRGWYDPAFSHGAAGIAFFLHATGKRAPGRAAHLAARWIASTARPCGEGCRIWDYYGGAPPEGKRDWVMNSWCHGAPGTVGLFVRLSRGTKDKEHLQTAIQGGGGILHAARMDQGKVHFLNPTYCCGAAGCIDAFSDLYVASGEKRWLVAARKMADVMIQGFCDVGGRRVHATYDDSEGAEKEHPYVATGFMHGNAGIGFALLRLALLDTEGFDALVLPPDHPFTRL